MKERELLHSILTDNNIEKSLQDNDELIRKIIPELNKIVGYKPCKSYPYADVWEHTKLALCNSMNNFNVRLTILLREIGLPQASIEDNYLEISAKTARKILISLGYAMPYADRICYLIERHIAPITNEETINNEKLTYERFLIQTCDTYFLNKEKVIVRKKMNH